MIVVVTGGRDYEGENEVFSTLDSIHWEHGIECVHHGGCPTGADLFADRWARARGVECKVHPADWAAHGRAAGPRRNARMPLEAKPDIVLAFQGGRGTRNCVEEAQRQGIRVIDGDAMYWTGDPTIQRAEAIRYIQVQLDERGLAAAGWCVADYGITQQTGERKLEVWVEQRVVHRPAEEHAWSPEAKGVANEFSVRWDPVDMDGLVEHVVDRCEAIRAVQLKRAAAACGRES